MDSIGRYKEAPFSKTRELVIDVVEQGLSKHHVKVLLELHDLELCQGWNDRQYYPVVPHRGSSTRGGSLEFPFPLRS